MDRIIKRIFAAIELIGLLLAVTFALTWKFDGFPVAVNLFKGIFSPTFIEFLSFSGLKDYLISSLIAFAICFIFENMLGKRISSKRLRHIISFSSGIVAFCGILTLLSLI